MIYIFKFIHDLTQYVYELSPLRRVIEELRFAKLRTLNEVQSPAKRELAGKARYCPPCVYISIYYNPIIHLHFREDFVHYWLQRWYSTFNLHASNIFRC